MPSALSVAVVAHVTTGCTMMAGTSAPLGCQVCRHCCPVQGCWSLRHPCSWSGWGCRPCRCCLVPFSCRYCCRWEAGVMYTTSPATTEFFLRCVFILCGRRARIMGSTLPCSLASTSYVLFHPPSDVQMCGSLWYPGVLGRGTFVELRMFYLLQIEGERKRKHLTLP